VTFSNGDQSKILKAFLSLIPSLSSLNCSTPIISISNKKTPNVTHQFRATNWNFGHSQARQHPKEGYSSSSGLEHRFLSKYRRFSHLWTRQTAKDFHRQ